jgi:peptidoglycan DL-endopeptidase CwlO
MESHHVRTPRVQRPIRVAVASVLAVVLSIALNGLPAGAEPTIQQVEAQLNAAWNEAEPLIEHYNLVHDQYVKNKAKQAQLQKQIAPLQLQLDLAQVKIGAMAALAYKGGQANAYTALLTTDSPRAFVDQLMFIDMMAKDQTDQVAQVIDAKTKYDAQKAPIDALVAQLSQQDADLAQQRKVIEAKLAALQQLRVKVYGTSGGIGRYRPWTCPSQYLNTRGYKAANFACRQAGKPYVWGADGPGSYDCSGLTMTAWAQVGVYLPHNAAAQRQSMQYVSRANIQIGDLVFYYHPIHHVAIYVGNGKVMAAPQAGDVVRMLDMDSSGPVNSIGRPG